VAITNHAADALQSVPTFLKGTFIEMKCIPCSRLLLAQRERKRKKSWSI